MNVVKYFKFDLYLKNGSIIRDCLSHSEPLLTEIAIGFCFDRKNPFKWLAVSSSEVALISIVGVMDEINQPLDTVKVEFNC